MTAKITPLTWNFCSGRITLHTGPTVGITIHVGPTSLRGTYFTIHVGPTSLFMWDLLHYSRGTYFTIHVGPTLLFMWGPLHYSWWDLLSLCLESPNLKTSNQTKQSQINSNKSTIQNHISFINFQKLQPKSQIIKLQIQSPNLKVLGFLKVITCYSTS